MPLLHLSLARIDIAAGLRGRLLMCNATFLKSIMCCGARNERREVMGVLVASA
jgi:hypothetical protein